MICISMQWILYSMRKKINSTTCLNGKWEQKKILKMNCWAYENSKQSIYSTQTETGAFTTLAHHITTINAEIRSNVSLLPDCHILHIPNLFIFIFVVFVNWCVCVICAHDVEKPLILSFIHSFIQCTSFHKYAVKRNIFVYGNLKRDSWHLTLTDRIHPFWFFLCCYSLLFIFFCFISATNIILKKFL